MADATGTTEAFDRRERFGSFEILRDATGAQTLLGKGTFGRTYQARHIFLERTVALKIINDRFVTDASARQRFLVEARAAAKLTHPHIAQILDFGETDGVLFYAMEYCSGGDLAEFVKKNGPLSIVQTLQIGWQIAGALQCAHGAGFIHRDLKPSNVMLATDSRAMVTKLIDFGLVIAAPDEDAGPVDPDSLPTIEQRFIGTPLFASPEQLLVQPLDPRSDFFALGMTLWFLLLGSAPDPGNSSAIVASRLSGESYADRLPRKLPRQFAQLLARLLEKKPEDRFAHATELLEAFGSCAASLGLPSAAGALPIAGAPVAEVRAAPPLQTFELSAPVQSFYTILAQSGESLTGSNYEVRAASEPAGVPFWLHILKASLAANPTLMERFRANAAEFAANHALVQPREFRRHPDATAVMLEKPSGLDLLSELKMAGALRLSDARTLLQQIAQVCDGLAAAGLPTPEMDGSRIFLEHPPSATAGEASAIAAATPRLFPRFLTQRETSSIAPQTAQSAASTISYDVMMEERVDAPGWQFAMLIYRVVSGKNCTIAASLSPQSYVAIPAISAEGNRVLANAIARQLVHPTCAGLLADLLITEGLMGGTRTHASASGPSSTAPTHTETRSPAQTVPPEPAPDETAALSAPAWETTGLTTQFRSRLPLFLRPPLAGEADEVRESRQKTRRWIVLGGGAAIVVLAAILAWPWPRESPLAQGTPPPIATPGDAELRLLGEIPAHARARLGESELPLKRDDSGWTAQIASASTRFPALLTITATGFKTATVELPDRASLATPQRVDLKRSEGTLLFTRLNGADYDHAKFRMTAQLPDEQAFVEVARYPLGASFGSDGKVPLPTGIYQIILQGFNPGVVRSRVIDHIAVEPEQTRTVELPLPIAGAYRGTVKVHSSAGEKTKEVELQIEPGLAGGSYQEKNARGERKISITDGRLDAEGTYTGRIQFSEVADVESQFDQLFSLKRLPDGGAEFEASESPEVNPTIEQRLKRQPYGKAGFFVGGTLRAMP